MAGDRVDTSRALLDVANILTAHIESGVYVIPPGTLTETRDMVNALVDEVVRLRTGLADALAEQSAENYRLQASVDTAAEVTGELRAKVDHLAEWLRRYGGHTDECEIGTRPTVPALPLRECNCGWPAVLAEIEGRGAGSREARCDPGGPRAAGSFTTPPPSPMDRAHAQYLDHARPGRDL